MTNKERYYPESKFGGFSDVDGVVTFFSRVNALLEPSQVLLDVGCGRGSYGEDAVHYRRHLRILKGKVTKVIGIDVDKNAATNPFLDEFHLIDGEIWPVDSNSIDLLICDNVVEHIESPDKLFQEIRRVMKDGGYVCIRTPNKWSYPAIAAALIPSSYHSKVTSVVQEGRKAEDVFPTLYRCNSALKLRRTLKKYGIEGVVYGYGGEPGYLAFSSIAYFFGVLHQKLAPSMIKPALFAFGKIKKNET